jgi:hypothetical protein
MGRGVLGFGIVGAIVAGACAGGAPIAACASSGSGGGVTPVVDSGPGPACTASASLQILFGPMYSAYLTDSTKHAFQIPAIANVNGSPATATWTASDPTAVSFVPDPQTGGTLITVKSAASAVTITAQVGAQCTATTQLHVTAATEADWQAGNARYNNGVPVYPGCVGAKLAPQLAEAGIDLPPPPDAGCPEAGPACTGCHGSMPTAGFFQGVEHTPEQTGGFTDQELVDIFVNGVDHTYDTTYVPYEYWHVFHTWTDIDTPAAQKAMVVYLRSLKPALEDGGVNFGVLHDAGILPD